MSEGLGKAGEYAYPGLPRFVTAIESWVHAEIKTAFDRAVLPDGHWRLFMGVVVWGAYVDRFLKFCVPSLSIPSSAVIVVHTDAAGVDAIKRGLAGFNHEIHVIPQKIIDQVADNGANKYWLIGGVHNLQMQQAKYRAHSYHMLMPDHVYGIGYFDNLDRLRREGKQAIVQGGLCTSLEKAGPALHRPLSAKQIAALSVDCMHVLAQPYLLNGRDDWPPSLYLVMVGERELRIVSPHISVVYLSHDLLMRAPMRMPNTIDAQLPFLIPEDVEPYMPGPEDGMAYMEISSEDKPKAFEGRSNLGEFCAKFWIMTYCHRGFERFFGLTTRLPFPEGYTPPNPMSEAEMDERMATLRNAVSDSYQHIEPMLPDEFRTDPILRIERQMAA